MLLGVRRWTSASGVVAAVASGGGVGAEAGVRRVGGRGEEEALLGRVTELLSTNRIVDAVHLATRASEPLPLPQCQTLLSRFTQHVLEARGKHRGEVAALASSLRDLHSSLSPVALTSHFVLNQLLKGYLLLGAVPEALAVHTALTGSLSTSSSHPSSLPREGRQPVRGPLPEASRALARSLIRQGNVKAALPLLSALPGRSPQHSSPGDSVEHQALRLMLAKGLTQERPAFVTLMTRILQQLPKKDSESSRPPKDSFRISSALALQELLSMLQDEGRGAPSLFVCLAIASAQVVALARGGGGALLSGHGRVIPPKPTHLDSQVVQCIAAIRASAGRPAPSAHGSFPPPPVSSSSSSSSSSSLSSSSSTSLLADFTALLSVCSKNGFLQASALALEWMDGVGLALDEVALGTLAQGLVLRGDVNGATALLWRLAERPTTTALTPTPSPSPPPPPPPPPTTTTTFSRSGPRATMTSFPVNEHVLTMALSMHVRRGRVEDGRALAEALWWATHGFPQFTPTSSGSGSVFTPPPPPLPLSFSAALVAALCRRGEDKLAWLAVGEATLHHHYYYSQHSRPYPYTDPLQTREEDQEDVNPLQQTQVQPNQSQQTKEQEQEDTKQDERHLSCCPAARSLSSLPCKHPHSSSSVSSNTSLVCLCRPTHEGPPPLPHDPCGALSVLSLRHVSLQLSEALASGLVLSSPAPSTTGASSALPLLHSLAKSIRASVDGGRPTSVATCVSGLVAHSHLSLAHTVLEKHSAEAAVSSHPLTSLVHGFARLGDLDSVAHLVSRLGPPIGTPMGTPLVTAALEAAARAGAHTLALALLHAHLQTVMDLRPQSLAGKTRPFTHDGGDLSVKVKGGEGTVTPLSPPSRPALLEWPSSHLPPWLRERLASSVSAVSYSGRVFPSAASSAATMSASSPLVSGGTLLSAPFFSTAADVVGMTGRLSELTVVAQALHESGLVVNSNMGTSLVEAACRCGDLMLGLHLVRHMLRGSPREGWRSSHSPSPAPPRQPLMLCELLEAPTANGGEVGSLSSFSGLFQLSIEPPTLKTLRTLYSFLSRSGLLPRSAWPHLLAANRDVHDRTLTGQETEELTKIVTRTLRALHAKDLAKATEAP